MQHGLAELTVCRSQTTLHNSFVVYSANKFNETL